MQNHKYSSSLTSCFNFMLNIIKTKTICFIRVLSFSCRHRITLKRILIQWMSISNRSMELIGRNPKTWQCKLSNVCHINLSKSAPFLSSYCSCMMFWSLLWIVKKVFKSVLLSYSCSFTSFLIFNLISATSRPPAYFMRTNNKENVIYNLPKPWMTILILFITYKWTFPINKSIYIWVYLVP